MTDVEEINIVKDRLAILDGQLKSGIEEQLMQVHERTSQHHLFWLLLDDRTFEPFRHALEIFKKYGVNSYFKKAIRKAEDTEPIQYNAGIAEVIAAAYYIEKFEFEKDKVVWERKVSERGNSVDITIFHNGEPINIEVTGLNEAEKIRKFWELSYKISNELSEMVLDTEAACFAYFVSLPNDDFLKLKNLAHLNMIRSELLSEVGEFIIASKESGVGDYVFEKDGKPILNIKILALEKSEEEYVANLIGWADEITDNKRIRNKVIEKATYQLPKDEINFVYIPNLAMLSDTDYRTAMYGDMAVKIYPGMPNQSQWHYTDTGITKIVEQLNISPVYGIIKGKLDYFDASTKLVIPSNRTIPTDEIIEIVS